MTESVLRLGLCLDAGRGVDAAELGELVGRLREQLLELDVERVDLASGGPAPPGARGDGVLLAGALSVLLAQSPELLSALVETVRSWVCRDSGRSARLEIDGDVLEVTGINQADQRELIKTWIDRHTDR